MAASRLEGVQADWLIGGSAGLLLQGVEISNEPRDLDMYADSEDAYIVSRRLADWAIDAPQYSETDIYRSILSHYRFGDVVLELVGAFQVIAKGCIYTVEASYLRRQHPVYYQISGHTVCLTPIAHELLFNLLRNRVDRYEAIAAVMRSHPERHQPALEALLRRNTISPELIRSINRLLLTDY